MNSTLGKVRQSRKQIMVSSILPKNERWDKFQCIKLSQRSFFGRIEDTTNCFRDLLTFIFNISFPYLFQCHVEIWPFDKGRRLGQRRVPCVRVCDPWPTRSKWSLPSIGERLNLVTSPVKLKFGFSSQFFNKSNTE